MPTPKGTKLTPEHIAKMLASRPHRYTLHVSLEERFWAKVDRRGVEDCWEWNANKQPNGYGRFWVRERGDKEYAHRVAYELVIGPIPEGLHVDHLCNNRGCVNPKHLEAVTQAENNRRQHARKRAA